MKSEDDPFITKTAEVARRFKIYFERVLNRSTQNEFKKEGIIKQIIEESTIKEI